MLYNQKGENLRRKERIRKRRDIKRLFEEGSRYYSKQYTLILRKNDLGVMRLAVSIKKGIGSAAKRNYEKRICREFFRREKGNIGKGLDILIIVKATTKSFSTSSAILKDLLYRSINERLDFYETL